MEHQIWTEGFSVTGNASGAHFWGVAQGVTLEDACESFAGGNPEFKEHFSKDSMTVWGCRIFDNESDARRAFG